MARRAGGPSKADLLAARGAVIPDLLRSGLDVVFCGINPGLYSAATGWHFARPGNRFWPALHRAGFTDRQLHPSEQHLLLPRGIGVTNLVPRATAMAAELGADELRRGARLLGEKVEQFGFRHLAVVGVTAYRTAFESPRATVGPQPEPIGATSVWVLPNPSGLNAHYQLDALVAEFARFRRAILGS